MGRRIYDRRSCRPQILFQPWIVRLLRLLDRMNAKFLNAWWYTGRRSRGSLDTCPHQAGLPCPLASAAENSGPDILSKAHWRLRDSKGCCLIPSRSEISGETRRSFYFPQRRGIVHPWLALLALARARKLEQVRVGQCRSGGIQNIVILAENGHFHKLIVTIYRGISPSNSIS